MNSNNLKGCLDVPFIDYNDSRDAEVEFAVRTLLGMKNAFANSSCKNAKKLEEMFQTFAEEVKKLA